MRGGDGSTGLRGDYARLVTLLSIGHLLAFIDRAKLPGAMPAIRRQIAMSDTAAGAVMGTAFALAYGVAILAIMALRRTEAPRWSWRLPLGAGLWAAASLATGLATSTADLVGARFMMGLGQALFIPAAVGWIVADGDRLDASAAGLSTFTAAASLGRSLGLFAIGLALTAIGWIGAGEMVAWRWSFALTALPNLVLLLVLVSHRPATSPIALVAGDAARSDGWVRPTYLLLAVMPIVLIQALGAWAPTLFVRDRGVTPQAAAEWLGMVTLVGGTGSQLVAGLLLQRVRRWRKAAPLLIVGGMTATLPCLALVGWGPGSWSATIGLLLADITLGLATFAGIYGWQHLTSDARRVADNGVFLAVITVVGVGLGPLVTGALADIGPTLRAALVITALGCVAVAAAAAAVAQPLYRLRVPA